MKFFYLFIGRLPHKNTALCVIEFSITVLFNAIIYYLDKSIKLQASFIKQGHNKKLYNLRKNDQLNNNKKAVKFI